MKVKTYSRGLYWALLSVLAVVGVCGLGLAPIGIGLLTYGHWEGLVALVACPFPVWWSIGGMRMARAERRRTDAPTNGEVGA